MKKSLLLFFLSLPLLLWAATDDSLYYVKEIKILDNPATHESIILRELPFNSGDTVLISDTSKLSLQAVQNLVNTSLFHFASVVFCDSGLVTVSVTERWYVWPVPFFNIEERNFNVWLRDMSLEKVTYGLYVYHENFRGRKEYLKLLLKTGYNQVYGFSYQKPYIDKKQNWGLSGAVGFEGSHATTVTVENHEPQGLKLPEEFVWSGLFASTSINRRVGLYQNHKLSLIFESTSFSDSLMSQYPQYAPSSNWSRFSANYQYRYDFRDFKSYPLRGWYADVELNLSNCISLGGANDKQFFVKSTSRKYFKIKGPLYFATGATVMASVREANFFSSAGFMGYGNDFVRGFQYEVIPVKHFLIHRNNLKVNVLPQTIVRIPFLKTRKFNTLPVSAFINVFFDQAFSAQGHFSMGNNLAGEYLAGYGIGIDLVTYYDKVFRLEFTMNRFREKGIFLHFTAPV